MSGSLVADLGVGPEVWLFLTWLGCVTLFFKFSRIWSVRNLDLLLLYALAPGMMLLVGHGARQPWIGFDLRLLPAKDAAAAIPKEGRAQVVVAEVGRLLHFRVFDAGGKLVVDTDERRLTDRSVEVDGLRRHLESLWPPHEPTRGEEAQVVAAVTSIVDRTPWIAFVWLFLGSALWLVRCLIDLGLARRPMLEPNLNAAGLACLSIGMLGLLIAETVSLPVGEGVARNPAEPAGARPEPRTAPAGTLEADATDAVTHVLKIAPLPSSLKMNRPQVILSRVLASLAHLGLVAGLFVVGWKHFERPIAGLAVATCYLLSPYTRIALVDSGQLVPAALIVTALACHNRPALAGALIGLAAGWMPACLGLISLWAGFYRGRWIGRFAGMALLVVVTCGTLAWAVPSLAVWARAMGARSLTEAGLLPRVEPPDSGSFWAGIDVNYRLPVLIAYLILVVAISLWPAGKNLGDLIALSAALLVASQFWYLDKGGTLVLLYLPLVLLMMFRPTLTARRPIRRPPRQRETRESLFPVR